VAVEQDSYILGKFHILTFHSALAEWYTTVEQNKVCLNYTYVEHIVPWCFVCCENLHEDIDTCRFTGIRYLKLNPSGSNAIGFSLSSREIGKKPDYHLPSTWNIVPDTTHVERVKVGSQLTCGLRKLNGVFFRAWSRGPYYQSFPKRSLMHKSRTLYGGHLRLRFERRVVSNLFFSGFILIYIPAQRYVRYIDVLRLLHVHAMWTRDMQ
jgi:hypothetical protein